MKNSICITRSHMLAKELKDREDNFITVSIGEREYIIESLHKKTNHANQDDSTSYLTIKVKEFDGGNIKR